MKNNVTTLMLFLSISYLFLPHDFFRTLTKTKHVRRHCLPDARTGAFPETGPATGHA